MRILMVSHGYPPILSGVTLVVQKLARAMVARGHTVTVVTASESRDAYEADDEGVRLIRVRGVANPFWEDGPVPVISYKHLEEIAAEVQPDVLHAHEIAVLGLQAVRLKRETELPLLGTCQFVPRFAARYLSVNGEPSEVIESLFWAACTSILNQFSRVVFATSAQLQLFQQRGLQVQPTIISNGVDTARYRPSDGSQEEAEARYELPAHPRILFVSRLAKDKEIDVLVRAMPRVWAERRAHLLLVGRGDDRERLEQLTAEMGLRHCVHFLGFVPEEELPATYRACDLFAIASTCEVQSLPTLQALATGLPVVAADALALPEVVHDGVNGLLVPPGDPTAMAQAMIRILLDSGLAGRMSQAGIAISRPHAELHTFDQYEALYRQMAG